MGPGSNMFGPATAYVAAASRLLFGRAGSAMHAGRSEVFIPPAPSANPDWIAADLLAQAEHDVSAQAILITQGAALARAVEAGGGGARAGPAAGAAGGPAGRGARAPTLLPKHQPPAPAVSGIAAPRP